MRLKEWFSWHFPELAKIVTDNAIYTKCVDIIGKRENIQDDDEELKEKLNEAVIDEEKTQ